MKSQSDTDPRSGVLLFGGSFNPIHHGHLIVGCAAAEQLGVERLVLIPSGAPPHKLDDPLAAPEDRLAMCRLAAAIDTRLEVSGWELDQPGPSYTLNTVRHFRELLAGEAPLFWLVGADSLAQLHLWHCVAELCSLCTIVTAARPGTNRPPLHELSRLLEAEQVSHLKRHILDTPQIDISATDIRHRVCRGQSIAYLVPEAVATYIADRELYRVNERGT